MAPFDKNRGVAGGEPSATPVSGASLAWQVVLWPHRSLSPRGLRIFLTVLGMAFALFAAMTFLAPTPYEIDWSAHLAVVAIVLGFMLGVFLLVWALFLRNYRDARYHERIAIEDRMLVIEANHPRRPNKRWEFRPYWTNVRTRTTRHVENQLLLSSSGKVVAIGAFLTPEERASLAIEIEDAIARFA